METAVLTAEKLVAGGDCLARRNGKNVFIPKAIPGEELVVRITKSARDYDRAEIEEVRTPSPHRVAPRCPLYGTCGGCSMQHIDDDFQQELRRTLLTDCFSREGIQVPPVTVLAGDSTGYRSRMQLHDGSLFAKATNDAVDFTACPVATPELNAYLSSVPQEKRPRGRVQIFADSRVSSFSGTAEHVVLAAEEPEKKTPYIQGGGKRPVKNKVKKRFSGTALSPENSVEVTLSGKTIRFDVRGFFQSNLGVLEKAVAAVTDGLHGKHVLDMYSGVGTFSVFLADRFEKVTLVEHNRDALVYAEINMAGKNHESYGVSGERFVTDNAEEAAARSGAFDAVVIDPPRSGMEKAVCDWLCRVHVPVIRSVSCDPVTQARDIARLVKAGYTLTALYLLDFYPQTAHIESLACLEYHA